MKTILTCLCLIIFHTLMAKPSEIDTTKLPAPSGLLLNLLENAGTVYQNGLATNLSLKEANSASYDYQTALIMSRQARFSWIVNDTSDNSMQAAYQIVLDTIPEKLDSMSGPIWNSGKMASAQSVAVSYSGPPLQKDQIYYWKVRIWNQDERVSEFSEVSSFQTGTEFKDYHTPRSPRVKEIQFPQSTKYSGDSVVQIDFGKDAFSQFSFTAHSTHDTTILIRLGEKITSSGRIDTLPGGTVRFGEYLFPVQSGIHSYQLQFRPDQRNTLPQAVHMPAYIGEVLPFRYVEIMGNLNKVKLSHSQRSVITEPFDDTASYFRSNDSTLNAVWDLCKYSIKATSFAGIYVDGDRERIPYEADALINQLAHYGVDRSYTMARYSHEYLIHHATWPTEWILQSVLMAWNDLLYTGDLQSAQYFYKDLQAKTLTSLATDNGLISSYDSARKVATYSDIHFQGSELRDIVDWPHSGILGLGKEEQGETDGFVFRPVNTVVNAYYYKALVSMSELATSLGKKEDARKYENMAEEVKNTFNKQLLMDSVSYYRDGIGTNHASLHANMFALAFGLVPEKSKEAVIKFIRTRGVACSVYGSQFLMDAIYQAHDDDYGLQLLASTDDRSWYNMIREGSTMTMEAWGDRYKPNQDWNHAWGAVPANIIPRFVLGVRPASPGFEQITIQPQPGDLTHMSGKVPTIRGAVLVEYVRKNDRDYTLDLTLPANTRNDLLLPADDTPKSLMVNGQKVRGKWKNGFYALKDVGSGTYHIEVGFD